MILRRKEINIEDYKYSVQHHQSLNKDDLTKKKITYIVDETLSDLGINKIYSMKFVYSMMLAILMLWVRVYIHYFGQYLILKLMSQPVTKFEPSLFKIEMEYKFFHIMHEIGVILAGVSFTSLIFCIMIFIAWICEKYIYVYPKTLYKATAWFGLGSTCDFALIAVVDFATQVRHNINLRIGMETFSNCQIIMTKLMEMELLGHL
jgi:hypothetical protein